MSAIGPMPSVEANGAQIPLLGLGTWELRGRTCARVVEQALRLGYRHIDTAEMYENEREVGEGLRASGVKRNDVFVTTKIWPSHFAPRELERAARDCLVRLRLSEVDLLLLHWPNPQIPLARDHRRAVQGQARRAGAPYRRVQLHCGADRRGGADSERTTGVRSGRVPSVPRPVESDRGLPRATAWRWSPIARSRAAMRAATRC